MSVNNEMIAAVLHGREDVRIQRMPIPQPGNGEVLVRIDTALTCGTDVKVFRRGYHAVMIRPPAVFGHEFAGTIVAIGDGVNGWNIGDRVVAANSAPCGDCYYCERSCPELCEDLLFLNGAYAEYIVIPARVVQKNLYSVPSSLRLSHAALAEPLACVVRGMDALMHVNARTAVVLGLGPIGLFFVRMLVLAGVEVIAVGRRASRLGIARELGAAITIDIDTVADPVEAVRLATPRGYGADLVVEAVGNPTAWQQAISMARKAGMVSLFGGCPADTSIELSTHRIHYDEISLTGTFHHTPAAFRMALDLLISGDVPAALFIQKQCGLIDLPGVLRSLAGGDLDIVKCAVTP